MSWEDIVASHFADRARFGDIQLRSEDYSSQEVLDEIATLLQDAVDYHAAHPERGKEALGVALQAATRRDRQRPAAQRGSLGNVAFEFSQWLIIRAGDGEFAVGLERALDAVRDRQATSPLGADLVAFVTGYLTGEIDETTRGRMMMDPHRSIEAARPVGQAPYVVGAEASLREAMRESRVDEHDPDPADVWAAFLRFAATALEVGGDGAISEDDGDLLLFEWGIHPSPDGADGFLISLVRQLSLADTTGLYSGMEQTGCEMWFEVSAERQALGANAVWSDGDNDRWAQRVTETAAFASVMAGERPRRLQIEGGPV